MPAHPNSLANLRPPWKQGETPNPGGRPKGVVYPVEHLRLLADKPVEELEAIRGDRRESVSRRAAAIMVLRMVDVDPDLQQKAFSEVADRTSGKAVQTVQVTQVHSADPSQILATLHQCYPRRVLERDAVDT